MRPANSARLAARAAGESGAGLWWWWRGALCLAGLAGCDPWGAGALPGAAPRWDPGSSGTAAAAAAGEEPIEHVGSSVGLAPSDDLFDRSDVPRFDVYLPDEARAALDTAPYEYTSGSFGYREEYVQDVGIRLKGRLGSFRTLDQKAAFKVSFDAFSPGRRWKGLEGLTLNNMVQDPSYLHETLAYTLYQAAGVPVPRTAHAEVWVNNELFGTYLLLDTLDDGFLARWFDDAGGNLYEGAYGVDLWAEHIDLFEQEEEGEPSDRADLRVLVAALDGSTPATLLEDLEPVLDVPAFLSMAAVDALLGHWDGYAYTANNYHLYWEPTQARFTFLPWGTDQTFNAGFDVYGFGARVGGLCLESEACRLEYELRLWQVTDVWTLLHLDDLARDTRVRIHDAVLRDPRREIDEPTWQAWVEATLQDIASRPDEVLAQLFPEGAP